MLYTFVGIIGSSTYFILESVHYTHHTHTHLHMYSYVVSHLCVVHIIVFVCELMFVVIRVLYQCVYVFVVSLMYLFVAWVNWCGIVEFVHFMYPVEFILFLCK